MYSTYLIFFIISHIVGDFYAQTAKLVHLKNKKLGGVFLHGLIYAVCTAAIITVVFGWGPVWYAVLFGLAHLIIDLVKWFVYRFASNFAQKREGGIYIADQLLHIGCIITVCFLLAGQNMPMLDWMQPFFTAVGTDRMVFFKWVCVLLLVVHPANVTFKKIFIKYKPDDKDKEDKPNNTGALIGSMERIVSVFLISMSQYAAIGLILTAKSIARYNKIAESKEFAEYYLIGTIFSILFSIVSYIIIF